MIEILQKLYTTNRDIRDFHFCTNSGFLHEAANYVEFSKLLDTLTEVGIQTKLINKLEILELELPKTLATEQIKKLKISIQDSLKELNNENYLYPRQINKVLDDISEFLSILQYKLENLS